MRQDPPIALLQSSKHITLTITLTLTLTITLIMPKIDNNFLSFSDRCREHLDGLSVCPERDGERSEDFDDLLKISHCCEMTFRNLDVCPEGLQREDGVDIMRFSKFIAILGGRVAAGRRYAFTIKGGSSEILLRNVQITRPGRWVDVDLGNYSHNADGRTGKVTLDNVTREDGKPVRVRVGWADRPQIIGGKVKVLRWQSWLLKAYVHSKRALVWVAKHLSGGAR